MIKYKEVKTEEDLQKCFVIRRTVFSAQGFDTSTDIDGSDFAGNVFHVLVEGGGKTIATGRIVVEGDVGTVGRMAVLEEYRGQGIGKKLFESLKEIGMREGIKKIVAGSQDHCCGFYEKMGLEKLEETYEIQGTGHTKMEAVLPLKSG